MGQKQPLEKYFAGTHYVGRRMSTVPLFVFRRSGFGTLTGQNNLRGNISNGPPLYVDGPFGTSTGGIPWPVSPRAFAASYKTTSKGIWDKSKCVAFTVLDASAAKRASRM